MVLAEEQEEPVELMEAVVEVGEAPADLQDTAATMTPTMVATPKLLLRDPAEELAVVLGAGEEVHHWAADPAQEYQEARLVAEAEELMMEHSAWEQEDLLELVEACGDGPDY